MSSIFGKWLASRNSLNEFEIWIVSQVSSRLNSAASTLLSEQIMALNTIQRHADGKEVNLYSIHHGKPVFPDNLRFLDRREEVRLATVTIKRVGERQAIKVELWIVNGQFFSITFNKPPKPFFADIDLSTVTAVETEVNIWFDPMNPTNACTAETVNEKKFTGWVHEWYLRGEISDTRTPLIVSELDMALRQIAASLPTDYIELVEQTDGASINGWLVHGPVNVRTVVLADSSYYVLAESEIGVMTVQEGSVDQMLYLYNFEMEDRQPIGTSLHAALDKHREV